MKAETTTTQPTQDDKETTNVDQEEEEEVDVELQNKMKTVTIDDAVFGTKEEKTTKKEEKTEKGAKGGKKAKKNKGEDFMDYAKKTGIQVNIQYEEKSDIKVDKKDQKSYQDKTTTKPDYTKPKGNYNKTYNYKEGNTTSTTEGNQGNTGGYDKDKPRKNYNNNKQGGKRPFYKVGDNKFDLFNSHLPQVMPLMTPQYNPYYMQGKVPFQNVQYPQQKPLYNPNTGVNLVDNSNESIIAFLEQYLGLENLNRDLYLRNRIDESGFIDCDEIVNHNKMKRLGITIDRLIEVLNENAFHPAIEANLTQNEKVVVRNREWEKIKDQLVSKDQIFQQKKAMSKPLNQMTYGNPYGQMGQQHPGMNLNYVTMQNNYFFTGMPQQEGGMGYNPMYIQYPYMGQNAPQTQHLQQQGQIEVEKEHQEN
jgi:hypothetical protein